LIFQRSFFLLISSLFSAPCPDDEESTTLTKNIDISDKEQKEPDYDP